MVEQELREKIAHIVFMVVANHILRNEIIVEGIKATYTTVDQILALTDAYYQEKYKGWVKLPPDSAILENVSLLKNLPSDD